MNENGAQPSWDKPRATWMGNTFGDLSLKLLLRRGPITQRGRIGMNLDVGILLIGLGILLEVLGIAPTPVKIWVKGIKVSGPVGAILILIGALLWAEVIVT